MEVRITDDAVDVIKALAVLVDHISEMPRPQQLAATIDRMVKDGSYRFVVADDGRAGPLDAAGVVTFFKRDWSGC
jgi:hypothetical protein